MKKINMKKATRSGIINSNILLAESVRIEGSA